MLDAVKGVRLCKNSVEHRGEIAERRVGGRKHPCQGRLAGQPGVTLGSAFGELTLQIGYPLPLCGLCRIIRCGSRPSPSLIPSPLMGEAGVGVSGSIPVGGDRPSRSRGSCVERVAPSCCSSSSRAAVRATSTGPRAGAILAVGLCRSAAHRRQRTADTPSGGGFSVGEPSNPIFVPLPHVWLRSPTEPQDRGVTVSRRPPFRRATS